MEGNSRPYRIRKGSLTENLYLTKDGTWANWAKAKKFTTQDAADKFAQKHGIGKNYGLFDKPCRMFSGRSKPS